MITLLTHIAAFLTELQVTYCDWVGDRFFLHLARAGDTHTRATLATLVTWGTRITEVGICALIDLLGTEAHTDTDTDRETDRGSDSKSDSDTDRGAGRGVLKLLNICEVEGYGGDGELNVLRCEPFDDMTRRASSVQQWLDCASIEFIDCNDHIYHGPRLTGMH